MEGGDAGKRNGNLGQVREHMNIFLNAHKELLLWAWSSAGCLPQSGCHGDKTLVQSAHSPIHSLLGERDDRYPTLDQQEAEWQASTVMGVLRQHISEP